MWVRGHSFRRQFSEETVAAARDEMVVCGSQWRWLATNKFRIHFGVRMEKLC